MKQGFSTDLSGFVASPIGVEEYANARTNPSLSAPVAGKLLVGKSYQLTGDYSSESGNFSWSSDCWAGVVVNGSKLWTRCDKLSVIDNNATPEGNGGQNGWWQVAKWPLLALTGAAIVYLIKKKK